MFFVSYICSPLPSLYLNVSRVSSLFLNFQSSLLVEKAARDPPMGIPKKSLSKNYFHSNRALFFFQMTESRPSKGASSRMPRPPRINRPVLLLTVLLIPIAVVHSIPMSNYYSSSSFLSPSSSSSSGYDGGGGGGVNGGDGLVLENRHLHAPCNFNPRCLCSSGGESPQVIGILVLLLKC